MKTLLRLAIFALVICSQALASEEVTIRKGIPFATVGEHELALDLYIPRELKPAPLIVWVHGGAWRRGSRDNVPIQALARDGFTIASVSYRLSPVARFPAQIHDIKAAIRHLRANAQVLRNRCDKDRDCR
jgi:acetyl esterase/lipase